MSKILHQQVKYTKYLADFVIKTVTHTYSKYM